jgi:hypothetical protein
MLRYQFSPPVNPVRVNASTYTARSCSESQEASFGAPRSPSSSAHCAVHTREVVSVRRTSRASAASATPGSWNQTM